MRFRHSIEMFGTQATVYVAGPFDESHIFRLNRLCSELPACVTTLRLDLHAIQGFTASTIRAVRVVLMGWRETRNGSFRLVLACEHMIAVYSEFRTVAASGTLRDAIPHIAEEVSPALSAMYL